MIGELPLSELEATVKTLWAIAETVATVIVFVALWVGISWARRS